jgi:hypothetical protein
MSEAATIRLLSLISNPSVGCRLYDRRGGRVIHEAGKSYHDSAEVGDEFAAHDGPLESDGGGRI